MKEYERRRARWRQGVLDRHRIIGRLLLTLRDEPQHVTAWRTGAVGEERLARILAGAADCVVLHDLRVPGTRGNIDHVVVAAQGVHVLDAKRYKGRISARRSRRGDTLRVGGRDCTHLAAGVHHQVEVVRAALEDSPLPVDVEGSLVFVDGDWSLFTPHEHAGLGLHGRRSLLRELRRPGPLGPVERQQVADHLLRTLRAA